MKNIESFLDAEESNDTANSDTWCYEGYEINDSMDENETVINTPTHSSVNETSESTISDLARQYAEEMKKSAPKSSSLPSNIQKQLENDTLRKISGNGTSKSTLSQHAQQLENSQPKSLNCLADLVSFQKDRLSLKKQRLEIDKRRIRLEEKKFVEETKIKLEEIKIRKIELEQEERLTVLQMEQEERLAILEIRTKYNLNK